MVVPEVGMGCAGGNDQVVVRKLESMQLDNVALEVEPAHVAQQNFDIFTLGKNLANGRRNFCRRQSGGRHLVEQRLKGMVVFAIDQRDFDGQMR